MLVTQAYRFELNGGTPDHRVWCSLPSQASARCSISWRRPVPAHRRDSRLPILGDNGVGQLPPVVRRLLGLGVR